MSEFDMGINDTIEILISSMPKMVKVMAVMRDELINQGFSREEAIKIISNSNYNKGS